MSGRFRIIAVGAFLVVASLFLYFSIRFKYVERDLIASLVQTTNRIVTEYNDMEKRLAVENRTPSDEELSAFLKSIHRKHRDIALLAITDSGLSLRLSSKNDRFIRTTALFEAILKDFTQEKFNISRTSPFVTRYYEEKRNGRTEQLKFYIFLGRIGGRRLLVAYPHTFGNTILVRTVLEALLVAALAVIVTAAIAIVFARRGAEEPRGDDTGVIELGPREARAARGDGAASVESSNIVSDTISGYVQDLFGTIRGTYGTDSVALYLYHPTGKLVKTMELRGGTFFRINSVSFDTIDLDNDTGREMREGATMILDGGSRVVVPLVYNNAFLGTVVIVRRQGLRGSDVNEIRAGMAGILKNIHDFIMFNDVMTDAATGLHSRIYFSLKYNEYLGQWKHRGAHFSVLFIRLFDPADRVGEEEKNSVIRLVAPTVSGLVRKDGFLCRYDDCIAAILHGMSARKAAALASDIRDTLARYRVKVSGDTPVRLRPSTGLSSSETAGPDADLIASALGSMDRA